MNLTKQAQLIEGLAPPLRAKLRTTSQPTWVSPSDRPMGEATRHNTSQWSAPGGETLILLTKDYPREQPIQKQLTSMGIACEPGQKVNLLDTQIGLVEGELGIAGIPSFGVLASGGRKVRITELDPAVTLEFYKHQQPREKIAA